MIELPADTDILELLPGFCEEWEAVLDERTWPRVKAARDVDGLRRLGHTIKGSFSQFGFPAGGGVGQGLVDCARQGDWALAERKVEELRGLVSDIRAALGRRDRA